MAEDIVNAKIVFDLPESIGGTPTKGDGGDFKKEIKDLNKTFKQTLSGQLTGLIGGGASKSMLVAETGAIVTALLAGGFVSAKILGFFAGKAREGLGIVEGGFTPGGLVENVGGAISEKSAEVLEKGKEILGDIFDTDKDIEESLIGQVNLSKDFNLELGTQKTLGIQVLGDLMKQLTPLERINELEQERNRLVSERVGPTLSGSGRSLAFGGPTRSNAGQPILTQDVDDEAPSTAPQTVIGPVNILEKFGIGD